MGTGRPALYEVLDDRFRTEKCAAGDLQLETLHVGSRWAEGPLYVPAWRHLIWSDIPNDRMLRWDEASGAVSVFRSPAGYSNGNTLDREGRLITCEQGNRRVTRTEHDGSVTVLADRYRGKRLNSPNDAAVKSDGSIWFSDPDFGITSDYEGHRAESEIGANNVYRIDPDTGEVHLAADGFGAPNGLVFSPDESELYVSDTRAGQIRAFEVRADGTLSDGKVFAETNGTGGGRFDNIRFDDQGHLWAAAMDDGVHCYAPDSTLLGRILVPNTVSNIRFGGPKNNRLFITANDTLYSLVMGVKAAPMKF
ncbi:SMP-30/gluconolactonase/LRE family protein [Streptomyces sp. NPDC051001]|uniref:SMP-30/gluconolactonase/LRE family protein n=1 Tax=Streptomyces sp. NPDC051001 TaxID=3155795 RepID=UPI00341F393C